MRRERRLRPDVKHWQPMPGQPLPMPVLVDDRDKHEPETVKNVLAMLERERPRFSHHEPTPITLQIERTPAEKRLSKRSGRTIHPGSRVIVNYSPGERLLIKEGISNWKPVTVEMNLRNTKYGKIEASFRYLAARNPEGDVIVGPFLGVIQKCELPSLILA